MEKEVLEEEGRKLIKKYCDGIFHCPYVLSPLFYSSQESSVYIQHHKVRLDARIVQLV